MIYRAGFIGKSVHALIGTRTCYESAKYIAGTARHVSMQICNVEM
jgi:hypothetical protein